MSVSNGIHAYPITADTSILQQHAHSAQIAICFPTRGMSKHHISYTYEMVSGREYSRINSVIKSLIIIDNG